MSRPAPADRRTDDLDDPFWSACQEGLLLVQRCSLCSRAYWPASSCVEHGPSSMAWEPASGHGCLESHAVIRGTRLPWFREAAPYVAAVVRLDEGVLFYGTVVGCPPEELAVGMPLQVEFEELDDGQRLPRFRPTDPMESP